LAWGFVLFLSRTPRTPTPLKQAALILAGIVTLQAMLGIITLRFAAPLALSLTHQIGAVLVLTAAIVLAWRVQRN
jgi:cytochrome c oxidase assembly protein subunit 15